MSSIRYAPYSLRNFRYKPARAAKDGFTATLLRNNQQVAVIDRGKAPGDSSMEITFINKTEMDVFSRHVAEAVPEDRKIPGMTPGEIFVMEEARREYARRAALKMSVRSTMFRRESEDVGTWHAIKAPFRPALAMALRAKYPGEKLTFLYQRQEMQMPIACSK